MKSRSGGLLFFDYFRFIQILNSPDSIFYNPSESTSESASIALKNLFAMVFPFELFLQAVRCCRHAYIIAYVRYIVKPKTGSICEKIFKQMC